MKKIIASLLVVILAVSVLTVAVSAWETPQLMLAAAYNDKNDTVTVYYRLLDFAGTESADFRLKYDPAVLELEEYEDVRMKDVITEIAEIPGSDGKIAIQFVDLYHVREDDCEEDGSATVATFTFKVKDKNSTETVFISTADSCAMDPDSASVNLERATLKIPLNEGSVAKSTSDSFDVSVIEGNDQDNANINKIIVAAVVTAVVFVAGLAVIVIKYRKKS